MATPALPFYPFYTDLRSSALSRRKKYSRKKSSKKNICCEICRPQKHVGRLSRRVEAKWEINLRGWHDIWAAEREHKEEVEEMDEIVAYDRFGKGKEVFERAMTGGEGTVCDEEGVGIGVDEKEEEWAVRMKETKAANGEMAVTLRVTTIKNGVKVSTTTCSDPYIPSILSNITIPEKYRIRYCRRENIPVSQAIYAAFASIGDLAWQWHRNGSGCWVLGYVNACGSGSFPCSCCCVGNGSMYYECSCAEFLGLPAPEDQQSCSLVEWVKGELWAIMVREEWARMLEGSEKEGSLDGEDWDVISRGVSEGWSVISSEEGFLVADVYA